MSDAWQYAGPDGPPKLVFPGSGGGSYSGPGDIVSGAVGFWSPARAYNAAFAAGLGPIVDLTDTSTGTNNFTAHILSTGFVDVSSITAHYGATAISVSKLYDQTGNGNDVTQATLASMPSLSLSSLNSLPGLSLNGSQVLAGTTAMSGTTTGTFSGVGKRTSGGFGGLVAAATLGIGWNSAANSMMLFQNSVASFTASDSVFHALQGVMNGASSVAYLDGSSNSPGNPGSGTFSTTFQIGQNASFKVTGIIMEGGFWPSILFNGTQQANMNANQHGSNGYNF